ncbi:hypothetical protein Cantr_08829 [Candida viswanathii]|uniref:Uncharacterized protein n=1 Tax=Candida viswanathii TaxID=5486 RepID=A0A367Y9K0_9ASCO|nr:hypothetical protein Cantr_08829 [Candida viswanathii]
MIQLISTSTQTWLSIYVITLTLDQHASTELTDMLAHVITAPRHHHSPSLLVLAQPYARDVFEFVQCHVLRSGKTIAVLFMNGESVSGQLSAIERFVRDVEERVTLDVGFAEVPKERLAFLMLNVPGFMRYLEECGSIEDAFERFVLLNNSIKKIVLQLARLNE